jgi:hypothetical protein
LAIDDLLLAIGDLPLAQPDASLRAPFRASGSGSRTLYTAGAQSIARHSSARSHDPAQLAVAMGQEPAADCYRDTAKNQQLVADDQAGEDHEG